MQRSTLPATDTPRQPSRSGYTNYRRLPADLAAELRHARHRQALSLAQAAQAAGITKPYLSRLERGLRAPRRAVAGRLIQVLDLSDEVAEWLLDEVADEWAGKAG